LEDYWDYCFDDFSGLYFVKVHWCDVRLKGFARLMLLVFVFVMLLYSFLISFGIGCQNSLVLGASLFVLLYKIILFFV